MFANRHKKQQKKKKKVVLLHTAGSAEQVSSLNKQLSSS